MRNCRRNCNRNRNCNCRCNRNYNFQNYTDSYNIYNENNLNCGCNTHSNNNDSRCGCMHENNNNYSNPFPSNYLYGHAYTPNQTMCNTFDPQTGLDNGSMFPELVSPYHPGQSMEFIEYLKTTGRNGGCD